MVGENKQQDVSRCVQALLKDHDVPSAQGRWSLRYEALMGWCAEHARVLVACSRLADGQRWKMPETSAALARALHTRRVQLGLSVKACAQTEGVYASVWTHRERARVQPGGFTLDVVVQWTQILGFELAIEEASAASSLPELASDITPKRVARDPVVSEQATYQAEATAAIEVLRARLSQALGEAALPKRRSWARLEVGVVLELCAQAQLVAGFKDAAGTRLAWSSVPGETEARLRAYRLTKGLNASVLARKEGGHRASFIKREMRARQQALRLELLVRWGLTLGLVCVLDEVDR